MDMPSDYTMDGVTSDSNVPLFLKWDVFVMVWWRQLGVKTYSLYSA